MNGVRYKKDDSSTNIAWQLALTYVSIMGSDTPVRLRYSNKPSDQCLGRVYVYTSDGQYIGKYFGNSFHKEDK